MQGKNCERWVNALTRTVCQRDSCFCESRSVQECVALIRLFEVAGIKYQLVASLMIKIKFLDFIMISTESYLHGKGTPIT